jgi:DNA replication protein DnaC
MKRIDLRDNPFYAKHVAETQQTPAKKKVQPSPPPLNVAPPGECCDGTGWYLVAVEHSHPEFGMLKKCSCGRAGNPIYKMAQLKHDLKSYSHCTFDTWNEKRLLEDFLHNGIKMQVAGQKSMLDIATKKAKAYAENPDGWIYMHGSFGSGKTHLAAAVGHVCVKNGMSVLYRNVPALLDELRHAIGQHKLDAELDKFVNVDVLILDDMGVEEMTSEFMNARLFRIFDERMEKPVVVTSNLDLDDLNTKVGGRIGSRLLQAKKIFLPLSDYRKYKRKE